MHSKLIHLPCLLGSTTFSVVGTWCNLFWSNSRTSERSGRFDGGGILSAVRSESKNVLSYQLLPFNHSNVSSLTTNKHFQFFPISRGNEKFEESCERCHLFLMNPMQELIAYKVHTDSVLSIRPCMPRERELAVKDKHLWKYRNKLYIEE